VYSEPRDAREAGTAIAAAARVLRRLDPADPTPYLLLRGYRWGELRALGEDPDPREFAKALAAPATEQRTRLKTLFLDERWDELLETAEELVSKPTGRGWLDLQRYVALAAERLGPEYALVSSAVKTTVRQLLLDVPELIDATLMDDVATASRDTRAWLEAQGLLDGGRGPDRADPDQMGDTDTGRAVRDASFGKAAALVRAGDPHAAIELLLNRAEHEASERERFITRAEAIEIMLDHGMKDLALPTLKQLSELVTKHALEEWEPAEVVAKPLALLYRCLDDGTPMKNELHDRLARLDPVFFMHATRKAARKPRPGGGSRPATDEAVDDTGDEALDELLAMDLDELLDEDED
jgi:type VI secretion system ImpA/VasJ family protein